VSFSTAFARDLLGIDSDDDEALDPDLTLLYWYFQDNWFQSGPVAELEVDHRGGETGATSFLGGGEPRKFYHRMVHNGPSASGTVTIERVCSYLRLSSVYQGHRLDNLLYSCPGVGTRAELA
jgi:hypothetical protein